jgi:hypothetical protein
MSNLNISGVSLPLAIQCNRITYFSAHDTGIMGEPSDANFDTKFRKIAEKITYTTLLNNLTLRQYPNERCLPDCNGQFLVPPMYDATNPTIEIQHCLISDDQKQSLDQIDIFDHSVILAGAAAGIGASTAAPSSLKKSEPANNVEVEKKVVEEYSQNLGRGARKRTQTQFFTQSLEFTQADDVDSVLISQTETNREEDDDVKLIFFTQPGAELSQDYIHGFTAMMVSQPEEPKDKLVGRIVKKFFTGYGWFDGIVSKRTGNIYEILYSDGDREGMTEENLRTILVSNDPRDNIDKSIDDTISQNNNISQSVQSNNISQSVQREEVKRKEGAKRKDSTKTPAQQAVRKENNKKAAATPQDTKSKFLYYYNHPDFKKVLNSLQTSKYLPCGFDENGKVLKALRVNP